MLSQYKAYIHAELLPSRTEASLGAAFTRTYQFFKDLGHQIQFQVLDNECPESLVRFFKQQRVILDRVPPTQKRANKAESAIQTFRNHFLSILVGTHPNFPINQWHHLLLQTEATLNILMLHAWPDNMAISAYHGLHRRPYDFLSHPMAPCGTLLVAHDPGSAKWDNHGRIGFYLGPALTHYRAYHCFIADTNATRICDSVVMFYPAPLVLPGASRFDQLLQLTECLVTAAESNPPAPHDQPLYAECLQKLKEFLLVDAPNAPERTPLHNAVPPTASTRHRPSTDIEIDLVGYSFKDRALGQCKVVGPSTYTDEDNIVWNTLEFTSTTYPIDLQFSKVSELRAWITKDKNHRPPAPVPTPVRPEQQRLTQGPIPEPPKRAILQAPN